ncbi:M1 family peptidase [Desertihabitans brevis]|uniref:Aminopeptidase N n=1 Tax=Desertihabitans brevis TaxID=2268447 RepID=A0A367YU28_9ACTN|nr:M1 family metallopeptidase [Desertihabitans brevis]RCK69386.1 M1 family peptidase [Desertihabitans brevis]
MSQPPAGPPLLTRPPGQQVAPRTSGRGGWAALAPALALPVVMVVVLVAVLGIGRPSRDEELAGAGDPYHPSYGASGYDAQHYLIDVTVDGTTVGGVTEMTARATRELAEIHVDLALPVSAAWVDGEEADVETWPEHDVEITPDRPVAEGRTFVVRIAYAGDPLEVAPVRGVRTPWYRQGDEQGAAGQPESSAWWFPANDHPSDPALMESKIRVRAGTQAVSTGALVSRDIGTEADWDTWHWRASQPMATYLNFVVVGRYRLEAGQVAGRPYVYAVSEALPPDQQQRLLAELAETPQWVAALEEHLGPYPFTEMGGVVPAFPFWFGGLETQTRPVYHVRSLDDRDFADTLLVHELAHMWFGDHVTLERWDDIFVNEAWASYLEWVVAEDEGGRTAQQELQRHYDGLAGRADFWRVRMDDPGAEQLFATVYERGPMALQALRNVMGEAEFTTLMREWAQRGGTASLEDFVAEARSRTDADLDPWYDAWISGTTAPPRTAAVGLG